MDGIPVSLTSYNKTINRTPLSVVRFAHNTTLSSARLLWRYGSIR